MDKPTENVSTQQLPPLEYAPQPNVGDLTLSRRDGVVTIQVLAGWRRILRAGWSLILCLIFMAVPLAFLILLPAKINDAPPIITVVSFSLIWGIATSIKPLLFTLRGHRWVASPTQLEFTGRRLTDIVNEVYPRNVIADLRVERVRMKNRILKRRGLVVIKPDGNKVVILFGTPAELDFACQTFKDALNLPSDPLGESHYQKPPRWSRIKRRVTLDGVVLTLFPPRIGIDGVLLILLSLAVVAPIDYWIENLNSRLGETWTFSILGTARVLLCAGFSRCFCCTENTGCEKRSRLVGPADLFI
jgi:hypothetical protein